ncbi:hypothetical protein ACHAW5_003113 [Stephanodiscus triporus]|uniref:BTB domain-containing protein n=1 Tax=Stephanodiscus triporus TaxID=2934178 RepID=A0ABD3MEM4_9STRA
MSNPRTGVVVHKSANVTVRFDGFAGLPAQRGERVHSDIFTCLGNEWELDVFPGGLAGAREGIVSVFLSNMSEASINVECGFSIKDCRDRKMKPHIFGPLGSADNTDAWGFNNFATRSKILDSLVDGALIIEVQLKLVDPPTQTRPPFIPENPSCKIIQGMFMDEESADIVFEVGGGESESNAKKKAKTLPVTFPAHRLILRKCSPTLAELCGSGGDKTTPIPIPDVSPDVFHHLLFHLYGGKVTDDDMKSHAKEIIDAADRYGVVDLKLAAEACLVETTAFSVENLLDLLLYAESKNCALLKEAAMDFMLENRGEVLEKVSFDDAPGAFVRDVLAALERGASKDSTDGDSGTDLSAMRISELRWKAHENGLNVDGSREMLIAALKEVSDEGA